MIFQHTYELVCAGTKTQTRRIQKPWQALMRFDRSGEPFVYDTRTGRVVYQAGKTYAVQSGRGQPAIGRIYIEDISSQDVREISDADVRAEGFAFKEDFLNTWTQMHDKPAHVRLLEYQRLGTVLPHVWENYLQNRPAERYQAWVLEFQLVHDRQLKRGASQDTLAATRCVMS